MSEKEQLNDIVNRLGDELEGIMKTPEQLAQEIYIQESNQTGVIEDVPLLNFDYGKEAKGKKTKAKE